MTPGLTPERCPALDVFDPNEVGNLPCFGWSKALPWSFGYPGVQDIRS